MKKRILRIGGIVALALLLAGAAFVGGRLLNGQGLPGVPVLSLGSRGQPVRGGQLQPAAELPQTPADVDGAFDHRQDQSIFVGTGEVSISTNSRTPDPQISHDGPVVEVVVTSQTTIYKDVTMSQYDTLPEGQVQQVLEPGSSDEIGVGSIITVWGRKTGDRFIAEVLVYTVPVIFEKK